jgi:hypothetical protein
MSHEIIYVGVVFGAIAGSSKWVRARFRSIGSLFRRKRKP